MLLFPLCCLFYSPFYSGYELMLCMKTETTHEGHSLEKVTLGRIKFRF